MPHLTTAAYRRFSIPMLQELSGCFYASKIEEILWCHIRIQISFVPAWQDGADVSKQAIALAEPSCKVDNTSFNCMGKSLTSQNLQHPLDLAEPQASPTSNLGVIDLSLGWRGQLSRQDALLGFHRLLLRCGCLVSQKHSLGRE